MLQRSLVGYAFLMVLGGILAAPLLLPSRSFTEDNSDCRVSGIHDFRALPARLQQTDIVSGKIPLSQVIATGLTLMFTNFNLCDGRGRQRNTNTIFGTGPVELLGREMTEDLHRIRRHAIRDAQKLGQKATAPLLTKCISFGSISALPDGTVDTNAVVGIDPDPPYGHRGDESALYEAIVDHGGSEVDDEHKSILRIGGSGIGSFYSLLSFSR
jgi:hypothetical protein